MEDSREYVAPLLDSKFYEYVRQNINEDVMRLRLKKRADSRFPLELAITQIEVRNRRIETKLPSWVAHERIVFPSLLATEQCSSEMTARYKSDLVVGNTLCDLTGGLGVDTYFMSRAVDSATYVERNELYCDLAQHNFETLGATNITVINSDCRDFLENRTDSFDTIFIDPARRGRMQERVFALSDCEPDVLSMLSCLMKRCKRLIIKMSPMVDITLLSKELAVKFDLHILSLRNDCKELLAVIDTCTCHESCAMNIMCVAIDKDGKRRTLALTPEDESNAPYSIATSIEQHLYEPDVALLKAGAFKTTAVRYAVKKLSKNSHLYTSSQCIDYFPGRAFRVMEVIPFSSSICRNFATKYPACNITTRNFSMSAVELRKRLKVRDGGDIYLIATSDAYNDKMLIVCGKINSE